MPVTIKRVKRELQTTAKPKRNQTGAKRGAKRAFDPVSGTIKQLPAFGELNADLGLEKMAIVDRMLLNGSTPESVARTIKLEWGHQQQVTLLSLRVKISKYKAEMVVGKLKYLTEGNPVLSKFAQRVDVLENLTRLVEIQQDRVSKALIDEEKHGSISVKTGKLYKLNTMNRFEIQLLGELYDKLASLQMDLGLLRKVPAKFQISGAAASTQALLEQALQRDDRVGNALAEAFNVLDGKFKVDNNEQPASANPH